MGGSYPLVIVLVNVPASGVSGIVVCVQLSYGDTCQSPKVALKSYTTNDATIVSNVAFLAEFTLQCSNGLRNFPVYVELDGAIVPAVRAQDGSSYQVSWTKDPKYAFSGDHNVRLFDEEGFANVRKAQRNGESTSDVDALATITVNHSGTYQGPWVNAEFVAALASTIIYYTAYSLKNKLVA